MGLKLVSTLIFSGRLEECKCEIYQCITNDTIKFSASLYIRRKVYMRIKEGPVSVRRTDTPAHKLVDAWVIARVLHDIEDSTLESAEASLEQRYMHEAFFIPAFFDSTTF